MKTATNRALREQRAECLREARALTDKGRLNVADQKRFDALMREAGELREQYEEIEARGAGGNGHAIRGGQIDGSDSDTRETRRDEEYRAAFRSYLRHGASEMPPEQRSLLEQERRDMGTGGGGAGIPGTTGGGFFTPVGFVEEIIRTLKFTGPMVDGDTIRIMDTDTGQVLPFPAENDVAVVGERIGEGQQVSEGDVNLGMVLFGAYKYSTKMVKVSMELLQDSAFDLEQFLIEEFAKRLGRVLVSDFTNGLGSASSQPMGIVTSTLANGTLLSATGSSTNDGSSASTNTIGSDDLINLEHSIDPLYRPGASYMMHDSTLKKFKTVKDKYGRPLWMPGLVPGQPDTFNGFPLRINNYMDVLQTQSSSPAVTRNTVIFGPLKRYMVRRVREMSVLRLTERYADYAQTAFIGYARYDGNVLSGPLATGPQFPFALLQNVY